MTSKADDLRPAYRRIADDLREEIRTGHLAPGSKIPSLRVLATQYRVSQVTASNAIRQLTDDGLLATATGRGTFVRDGAPEALREGTTRDPWVTLTERVALLEDRVRHLESRLPPAEDLTGETM